MRSVLVVAARSSSTWRLLLLLLLEVTAASLAQHTNVVIAVGKRATCDGSTMLLTTLDALPSSNNALSQLERVYPSTRSSATAPSASHTRFSYLRYSSSALINEQQLSVAHCACRTHAANAATRTGATVRELAHEALEHCASARCAVQCMGDTAVARGVECDNDNDSVVDDDAGDFVIAAGAVVVADKRGNVWIFHVWQTANTGDNTVAWAAQRLTDDHVAVVTSHSVVSSVDPNDPEQFMASTRSHVTVQPLLQAHDAFAHCIAWQALQTIVGLPSDAAVDCSSSKQLYDTLFSLPVHSQLTLDNAMRLLQPRAAAAASVVLQTHSDLPDALGGVLWLGVHAKSTATATLFVPLSCAQQRLFDIRELATALATRTRLLPDDDVDLLQREAVRLHARCVRTLALLGDVPMVARLLEWDLHAFATHAVAQLHAPSVTNAQVLQLHVVAQHDAPRHLSAVAVIFASVVVMAAGVISRCRRRILARRHGYRRFQAATT